MLCSCKGPDSRSCQPGSGGGGSQPAWPERRCETPGMLRCPARLCATGTAPAARRPLPRSGRCWGVTVLLPLGPPRVLGWQPWAYLFLDWILGTLLMFLAGTSRSRGNLRVPLPRRGSAPAASGRKGSTALHQMGDRYIFLYIYIYIKNIYISMLFSPKVLACVC